MLGVLLLLCVCLHNPPNSDMDDRIFNVRPDVNAGDPHERVRTHLRESALKITLGE